MDGPIDDGISLLNRVVADYQVHGPVSEVLHKVFFVFAGRAIMLMLVLHFQRFISLASTQDVEPLSHMCKVLSRHDITIDLLSLHMPLDELLGHGLHFVHNFTCEGVGAQHVSLGNISLNGVTGDPQTAVSQFGVVVQFMQLTIIRLQVTHSVNPWFPGVEASQLASFSSTLAGNTLRADFLLSNHRTYVTSELSPEELAAFHSWHKALFGRDSEGIDDHILRQVIRDHSLLLTTSPYRSTNPLTLLRIAPTLLSEAVAQAVVKILDPESLRNGVQFFIGPLLNWTLVGVIKVGEGISLPVHAHSSRSPSLRKSTVSGRRRVQLLSRSAHRSPAAIVQRCTSTCSSCFPRLRAICPWYSAYAPHTFCAWCRSPRRRTS